MTTFTAACRLLVVCFVLAACTGKGEPTSPSKMIHYADDNVKRSVKGASGAARRAGHNTAHAVESVRDGKSGNDATDNESGEPEGGSEPESK